MPYDRYDERDYRRIPRDDYYDEPEDYRRRRPGRPRMEDDYDEVEMKRGGTRRRRDSRGRYMSMGYDDGNYYEPDIYMEHEKERRPKIGFGASRDYERGHGMTRRDIDRIDKREGEEWMHSLKNSDGSGTGAHWTMDQTRKVFEEQKIREKYKDEVDEWEFYLTLNMIYADFSKVAKENNVNSIKFYSDMAIAFLLDDDGPSDKLARYYFGVVDAE